MIWPLINEEGEVRELTVDDMKLFKPFSAFTLRTHEEQRGYPHATSR
jgi:hypothetical protein